MHVALFVDTYRCSSDAGTFYVFHCSTGRPEAAKELYKKMLSGSEDVPVKKQNTLLSVVAQGGESTEMVRCTLAISLLFARVCLLFTVSSDA